MSARYAHEKFYIAVQCLVGDGPLKDRLESAAVAINILQETDMPAELRERLTELQTNLTKDEAEFEGEGKIKATVRNMSNEAAEAAADEFVSLLVNLYGGL